MICALLVRGGLGLALHCSFRLPLDDVESGWPALVLLRMAEGRCERHLMSGERGIIAAASTELGADRSSSKRGRRIAHDLLLPLRRSPAARRGMVADAAGTTDREPAPADGASPPPSKRLTHAQQGIVAVAKGSTSRKHRQGGVGRRRRRMLAHPSIMSAW